MACRFCFAEETNTDPLWSPCNCRGSVQYIHKHCLMEWMTVAPEQHRYRCQLCLTHYTFPRLWSSEQYPLDYLPGERLFVYRPTLLIILVNSIYLMYSLYVINTPLYTISTDIEYPPRMNPSRLYFNMILGVTGIYGIYFARRFISVRNKTIYIAYMCIPLTVHKPVVLVATAILILMISKFFMIPLGIVYVMIMSRILREHEYVIHRMNADAQNIALM
jgi:hypothetical protein